MREEEFVFMGETIAAVRYTLSLIVPGSALQPYTVCSIS
jgi:hypothetical protein